jgi:hypothetical protein
VQLQGFSPSFNFGFTPFRSEAHPARTAWHAAGEVPAPAAPPECTASRELLARPPITIVLRIVSPSSTADSD